MKTIKVLLIEDNPIDLLVIKKMLGKSEVTSCRNLHFLVDSVSNLSDCRKILKEKNFDFILLDLGLPDSWGMETFTIIFKQCKDVPIIILSSINDESIAYMAVANGAKKYLIKGLIDKEELISSILEALD